jgi:hypothetical protein
VRKYIKNKPRIVSTLLSEDDQKRVGLTEKDLLARDDTVGGTSAEPLAKDDPAKTSRPAAGKPGGKKISPPRPAGSGKTMGNRKP